MRDFLGAFRKRANDGGGANEYERRIEQQKLQYANKEKLKKLPDIYRYWSRTYLQPKLEDVFGRRSIYDIYSEAFIGACQATGSGRKILSIGCGDGQIEVAIAENILKTDFRDFKFLATELADVRMERAKKLVHEKKLEDYFDFKIVDVNEWEPNETFAGIMAQHTLHHIVELEKLFAFINRNMEPEGVFPIVDIIGRNGHMRWPETLEIMNRLWSILPQKYKFNHQFNKTIDPYLNHDCSKTGFEGIRAEDILPLLCDNFSFTHFVGVGGFEDVFVERGYGHNFDPENETDRAWIDTIAVMNDAMLETGAVKPTMIFAVAKKKNSAIVTRTHRGLSPENAIRKPD
ncbi:MAG: class I SAM-dependent methyltransferase [Hyphomicrobiaceae bacterium]